MRTKRKNGYGIRIALSAAAAVLLLSSCGAVSSEKQEEVKKALDALSDQRAQTEAVYDTLVDETQFVQLTEMGKRLEALAQMDLSVMTDEVVDGELLPALEALSADYDGLRALLEEIAEEEEKERKEREGRKQFTFHVVNKSGEALTAPVWGQGTAARPQTALLQMEGTLADGETLAGVTVTVSADTPKTLWLSDGDDAARHYAVGGTDTLSEDAVYYLMLLPGQTAELTDDPAELSEKETAD